MKKNLTWLAGAGAALASVAACLVIFSNRGPDLEALAKDYKEADMFWTVKDFPPASEVSDSENAAPVISKAMEVWPRMRGAMEFGFRFEPKTKEEADEVLERMSNLKPSLEIALQASQMKGYSLGWDWDKDMNKVVPELQSLRLIVRALCQKSQALLVVEKTDEALESWEAALRLTLLARTIPDSSAALLASSMSASVSRTAVKAMDRRPNDARLIDALAKGLTQLDNEPDWRLIIKADGYAYLATLRNSVNTDDAAGRLQPDFQEPESQKKPLVREGIPAASDLKEMTGGVLKAYAQLGEAISSEKTTLPDAILLAEKLEDQAGSGGTSRSLSSLSRSLRRIGAGMGHARAAHVLAVVLKERSGGKKDLADLEDVPGGPWLDPLSGLPLKFSNRKEMVKIWSIGANLSDDGGLSREEASAAMQDSLTETGRPMAYDEVAANPISLPQPKAPPQTGNPHVQWLETKGSGPAVINKKAVRSQAMMVDSAMGAFAPGHLGVRRTTGLEGSL
jgi:hypothetical protein